MRGINGNGVIEPQRQLPYEPRPLTAPALAFGEGAGLGAGSSGFSRSYHSPNRAFDRHGPQRHPGPQPKPPNKSLEAVSEKYAISFEWPYFLVAFLPALFVRRFDAFVVEAFAV